MSSNSIATPAAQPEDYRGMLQWVCIANWCAIALALVLELVIRLSDSYQWPRWGNFSWTYNLVLLEFALVTFGVTLMLRNTAWLDRAPRAALARLRYLLLAVLMLDALHFIGLFMTTGGIHGPMMVLLPVGVITIYLLLPRRDAHLVVGVFLSALLLTLLSDRSGGSQGLLSAAFASTDGVTLPWLEFFLAGLLSALLVGMAASGQMERAGIGLQRRVGHDPQTGLFTRDVLERRVPGELGRIGRSESTAALLMIGFKNVPDLLTHGDYAGYDAMIRQFAQCLRSATRETSDTCARHDVATFGVLLPTASAESAAQVVERIQRCAEAIRSETADAVTLELAVGVASTTAAAQADPDTFIRTAEQALAEAYAGDAGHQVVSRTL